MFLPAFLYKLRLCNTNTWWNFALLYVIYAFNIANNIMWMQWTQGVLMKSVDKDEEKKQKTVWRENNLKLL